MKLKTIAIKNETSSHNIIEYIFNKPNNINNNDNEKNNTIDDINNECTCDECCVATHILFKYFKNDY